MKIWFFIGAFLCIGFCMAQTNIYIPFSFNQYLNNKIYPPLLSNIDNTIKKPASIILSDNGGKVLLSFDRYFVGAYNTHGNLFIPNTSLGSPLIKTGGLEAIHAVRLNDSLAALVYYNGAAKVEDQWKEQLFFTFVDFKYDKGNGKAIPGKTNIVLRSGHIRMTDICRTFDGNYLIIAQINEYLYMFKMDDKGVTETDSLYNPVTSGFPDVSKIVPDDKYLYKDQLIEFQFSHSSNFLICNLYKNIYFDLADSVLPIYTNNFISQIYFDKQSNKFQQTQTQVLNNYIFLRNNAFLNVPLTHNFRLKLVSPNNKFYYIENERIPKYPYMSVVKTDRISQYLQFDIDKKVYTDSVIISGYTNYYNYLSPSHKLNLLIEEDIRNPKMYEIDPNKAGMGSNNFKYLKTYNRQLIIHNPDVYEYVKIKVDVTYDCNANVNLVNESDLSGGIDKFKWVITKQNGTRDTLYGFNQKATYTKNGKYGFKVFASSDLDGGYGEWYYDTIEIHIPEKAMVNFKANDTIICRYLPLQFKNYSKTVVPKPGYTPTFVWTFGDGSPSSNLFDPTHTYTQPGYYTVSLFYSNGYCDSTLTKNQYIHVVDAPKAGFTVANKQGCSPFTAQFTDTVSLNVTKKEYFFSDSVIWKPISKPKFSYTFTKPGHYWAVQKLYGHTGCVIRTDSVQVFVSKGLLLSDSIRIVSASYDLDNVLHLDWLPHPAAINYQTFKSLNGVSFSPLGQTKDTFITDKAVPVGKVFYQVKGVDSCGSFSSSQNIAAPAFISGHTVNGNEAALINQNLQEGFGTPFKTQLYGSFDTKFQFIALKTNPANPFTDPDFAEQDALRKCYRLVSNFTNQDMFSNNFCLDYVPVVYMPNIFSPDGNGLNDKFGPITYGVESYIMSIYNRWGEIIYAGSEAWNGNYKGQVVMDGIYFYQVFLTENSRKVVSKKGTVQVLR